MEKMVDLLIDPDNIRMVLLMMFGCCGYIMLKSQMKGLEYSLSKRIDGVEYSLGRRIDGVDKRIDGVEYSLSTSLNKRIDGVEYSLSTSLNKRIDDMESSLLRAMDEKIGAFHAQLKANDFAHLNNTIETLTFMLEKNEFLKREDKEFIDKQLDR